MEEHAALLSRFCDHLEAIETAVAAVTVPTAEGYEWAVEAIVPGSIFVYVPQAILICTHLPSRENDTENRYNDSVEGHPASRTLSVIPDKDGYICII